MDSFTKYTKEVNLAIAKNDDKTITYTDDDSSKDLTNFTQKFLVSDGDVDELFNNPLIKVTDSDMTVSGNTSSFVLPDTLNVGIYSYRWVFTDADGKDQTPIKGKISLS